MFSAIAGFVMWRTSTYIAPAKKDFTLTFINVGWEYQLYDRHNRNQKWNLFEGQINVTEGMDIRLGINRDDYHKTSGFMFNNIFVEGDWIPFEINQSYSIKSIIVETQLKKTSDILKQNNIIPVNIDSFKRYSRFSHSLTYLRISSMNDFINLCQSKEPILHLRGRLQNQGFVWDAWDYYILVENETVYYLRDDVT